MDTVDIYHIADSTNLIRGTRIPCPLNAWNHFAIIYTNSDAAFSYYVNGQLVSRTADNNTLLMQTRQAVPDIRVGADYRNNYSKAYVKNFRILDGVALWTSEFTPPTASDYT